MPILETKIQIVRPNTSHQRHHLCNTLHPPKSCLFPLGKSTKMAATDYGSQGSKKYFELSAATEYTPLFENVSNASQYDPTKTQISASTSPSTGKDRRVPATIFVAILMIGSIAASFMYYPSQTKVEPFLGAAWSSKADPFSIVDPADLGIQSIGRPDGSQPGPILSNLMHKDPITGTPSTPLPTNTWYQNLILGDSNTQPENKIFQIPHIIDTGGYIAGIRTHPCHLQANDRMVMVRFLYHVYTVLDTLLYYFNNYIYS